MAHNNHFFFNQLANLQHLYEQKAQAQSASGPEGGWNETGAAEPEPIELEASEERMSPKLKIDLERQFSSVETLRSEFLSIALGMFGPGFVWLVKNANTQDLRILTTYLAGSPYTAAHWRRQTIDLNTASADKNSVSELLERAQTGAGNSGGRFSQQAPGGTDVIPLLCLNTWEHVWLTDYGITGKREFVHQWWEAINWDKVESLAFPNLRDSFR
jgi:superoxide dismutase, Fe-Mn family